MTNSDDRWQFLTRVGFLSSVPTLAPPVRPGTMVLLALALRILLGFEFFPIFPSWAFGLTTASPMPTTILERERANFTRCHARLAKFDCFAVCNSRTQEFLIHGSIQQRPFNQAQAAHSHTDPVRAPHPVVGVFLYNFFCGVRHTSRFSHRPVFYSRSTFQHEQGPPINKFVWVRLDIQYLRPRLGGQEFGIRW